DLRQQAVEAVNPHEGSERQHLAHRAVDDIADRVAGQELVPVLGHSLLTSSPTRVSRSDECAWRRATGPRGGQTVAGYPIRSWLKARPGRRMDGITRDA